TPNFEQAGDYTVVFEVSDGDTTVKQPVKIEVLNVNRKPVFDEIPTQTVKENEKLIFTVSATDPDEGSTLQFSAENLPAGAEFDEQSGAFNWQPGFDQQGEHQIVFKVSDGQDEARKMVTIKVENVNRPPKINGPDSKEAQVGEAVQLKFEGSDPDGDELTFSSDGLPSGASLDANSGQFSWTPSDDQQGKHTFTVKVSDGRESASMSVNISVKPRPQAVPPDTSQN
ncbi:MAG TPA: hypothetical protein ENL21_00945, partial [Caldithrix abyssi]|nr:hypothetical protein [Caldithrix abyssi]